MYNVDEETLLKEVPMDNIKFEMMYQKAINIITLNKEKKENK